NPFSSTVTAPDGLTPFNVPDRAFLLSDPFPNGLRPVTGSSLGLKTSLGNNPQGFLLADRHPYIQQWNFGVQRELPGNLLVEAAYVGNHGARLLDYSNHNFNALPDQYLSLGNSLFSSVPNPFFGVLPADSSVGAADSTTLMQLLEPYPQFSAVNASALHRS